MIDNFLKVLDFDQLFLKLDWLIEKKSMGG